jgi:hypothetical protein
MADEDQEQEGTPISVLDKAHPALGATEEEQDVSQLNRIVVPVGAYTDPSNPAAASASINMTLDKSPVEHDASYGESDLEDAGVEADAVSGTIDGTETEGGGRAEARSEDRGDWLKADWQNQAAAYGLTTGGTVDELRDRVDEYESDPDNEV